MSHGHSEVKFGAISVSLNVIALIVLAIMLVRVGEERKRADRAEAEVAKLEKQISDQYINGWIKEAQASRAALHEALNATRRKSGKR